MRIREMTLADLKSIVSLERQLFTSAWNYEDFVYEISQNQFSYNYILEDDDEIVGYVGVWMMYEQAQITTIGVDPRFQRRGYGRYMMEAMLANARAHGCETMSLEVRVSNNKAIALYESLNFQRKAIRKNYYQDNNEDAYLMIKELEEK